MAATLSLIPILFWLLVRAKARRPSDPYLEAWRELESESPESRPIEPGEDPHVKLDRMVDSTERGLGIVNVGCASVIIGVVLYGAVVDSTTRYVVAATTAVLVIIWAIARLVRLRREEA
jgi:hypothetical protein